MKVSVASLNFNQKDLLTKLYNSLLQNKDYLDVWSLWDDGSTDGSVELIKSWEKEGKIPMVVNYSPGKSLMGVRMNWAIQNTKDLFIQVFGDSYIEPDGLKKITEDYIEGSAGSGYRIDIDAEGRTIREDFRFEKEPEADSGTYCLMQKHEPWRWLCGNGFIARRKDMEKIGWYDEAYTGYGYDDYDWFMRLMMNGVKLYAYNNIKVYHHDHPTAVANPDNLKRYMNKQNGNGYMSKAKRVILDLDDFSVETNNLFYLDQLKRVYPKFKVSMFYVPFDAANYNRLMDFQREEIALEIRKRDWIELIPHGLCHTPHEMVDLVQDDYDLIFKGIQEGFDHYSFPMVRGFKAPQWEYKENLIPFLEENGYWLAVDRNQPTTPRTKRFYEYTHSIDEPFWLSEDEEIRLHGHIAAPSKNNLVDCLMNLMKVSPDAEWMFVSEVV